MPHHLRRLVLHGVGYATVLVLGVGGTATALAGKNTVFSDDITNGEVRMRDLAPGTARDLQMPDVLPSGKTMRGTWGFDGHGAGPGSDYRAFVHFPVAFPGFFETRYYGTSGGPGCPGFDGDGAPLADPGNLCVYQTQAEGAGVIWAGALSTYGFEVIIQDDGYAGELYASGLWAATAP